MSQEVFEIVQGMDTKQVEIRMALQCAPVLAGLKASNLLIVKNDCVKKVKEILKNTPISCFVLLVTQHKTMILLYRKEQMESYLSATSVKGLFKELGYKEYNFSDILSVFQRRYGDYMAGGKEFPHEMGLVLGYPAEDVEGFIKNEGKNFFFIGYWKVYANPAAKKYLFQQFEAAKETMVKLISQGVSVADIIHIYNKKEPLQAAI